MMTRYYDHTVTYLLIFVILMTAFHGTSPAHIPFTTHLLFVTNLYYIKWGSQKQANSYVSPFIPAFQVSMKKPTK